MTSMNNLVQQFYKSDHVQGFYLPSLHSVSLCAVQRRKRLNQINILVYQNLLERFYETLKNLMFANVQMIVCQRNQKLALGESGSFVRLHRIGKPVKGHKRPIHIKQLQHHTALLKRQLNPKKNNKQINSVLCGENFDPKKQKKTLGRVT